LTPIFEDGIISNKSAPPVLSLGRERDQRGSRPAEAGLFSEKGEFMKVAIFIATVIFGLLFFWTARYEIFPTHEKEHSRAYRLDKWTGEVTYFSGQMERDTRKVD
jgi:hypothetical protein